MDKPFWKSKKFIYALGTFLAALVVWIMPQAVSMTAEQTDMLTTILPGVFVTGLMLIAGHAATDITAIWLEGVKAKSVKEAALDVVSQIPLNEVKRE